MSKREHRQRNLPARDSRFFQILKYFCARDFRGGRKSARSNESTSRHSVGVLQFARRGQSINSFYEITSRKYIYIHDWTDWRDQCGRRRDIVFAVPAAGVSLATCDDRSHARDVIDKCGGVTKQLLVNLVLPPRDSIQRRQ